MQRRNIDIIQKKAGVLIDALPYFRDFAGKTIVICYACNDILTGEEEQQLMVDLTMLHSVGIRVVLVHDTRMGSDRFHENKRLAKLVEYCGVKAIGICGIDEQTLHMTMDNNYIPVITPNDVDTEYMPISPLDSAMEIACLLKAEKLIYLSRFDGIRNEEDELQYAITESELVSYLNASDLPTAMRRMLNNGVEALHDGVVRFHVMNGKIPHGLLLELFSINGVGTMVMSDHTGLYSHEKIHYAGR